MQQAEFKNFRDNKSKMFISYWNMNKGETFFTCDLTKTGVELGDDDQIQDYGCTFAITGSYTYQEMGSETISTVNAGDAFNRRPLKAVLITALEDNSRWCYALHFDSLFTSNESSGLDWDTTTDSKTLEGESIKISAGETLTLLDNDKDIYIVNPIYDTEIKAISYKKSSDETFTNLIYGKYLKIGKGKSFDIQSSIDTYIPKVYYSNK